MDNEAAGLFEGQGYMSPSDRIKVMVLSRWERVENYYDEVKDINYMRTTKSLGRILYVLMSKDEKEVYDNFEINEETDIKEIEEKKIEREIKNKEIEETMFKYAEFRMRLLTMMLGGSPIVQKEIEVDFQMPQKLEDIEKLRLLVKSRIPKSEGVVVPKVRL